MDAQDDVSLTGRANASECILPEVFSTALRRINPQIDPETLDGIVREYRKDYTGTDMVDTNYKFYNQLRNGLWNTVKFVLYSVPFCIAVPLVLALALHTKARGSKFFQAVYYFPSLLSITTVTLSWRYMFSPDYGVMNRFFGSAANWFTPPYS